MSKSAPQKHAENIRRILRTELPDGKIVYDNGNGDVHILRSEMSHQVSSLYNIDRKLDRMVAMLTEILTQGSSNMAAIDDLTAAVGTLTANVAAHDTAVQAEIAALTAALAAGDTAGVAAAAAAISAASSTIASETAALAASLPPV